MKKILITGLMLYSSFLGAFGQDYCGNFKISPIPSTIIDLDK